MAVQTACAGDIVTVPVPLSIWWQRPQQDRIAITEAAEVDAGQFEQKVAGWMLLLAKQTGSRWAVFHEEGVEFLAILCALWQLGKTACIPGDNLPGTVSRLSKTVAGFIGQFDHEACLHSPPQDVYYFPPEWHQVDAALCAIEVYTSGSTAAPKAMTKTLSQLEQELISLDGLMAEAPTAVVIGTVTHQHLYGLTFRLLRPFSYRQTFVSSVCGYPEDVIAAAKHAQHFTYISSPAHLSRMAAHQDWQAIQAACDGVYSSAAPLNRTQSQQVAALLQAPVIEIYGSSETGAIAWRCQQRSQQDALWQTLPGVVLKQLNVSTLAVTKDSVTTHLADQVIFDAAGQFTLSGRSDAVVKVEGKRLSLNVLSQQLCESPLVAEAEALLITRQRTETGMVVVLSEAGQQLFKNQGRKALVQALKKTLSAYFEAVVLPRRWRFVAMLPHNQQGKTTQNVLQGLFDKGPVHHPEVYGQYSDETGTTLLAFLPGALSYFDGHFSQQAVLPGIVQLDWAEHFAKQFFSIKGQFVRVEALKFQKLLFPNDFFSLHVQYQVEQQKLLFQYRRDEDICSSGRICFA